MSVEEADGDPGSQLTPSQSSLLKRVRSAGPSTPADLARAELVRPQSVLATLKPLVEASLVERYPHPTDGRQILIVLSERGRNLLAERDTTRSDVLALMIAERLNPAEQRTVAEAATLLRRLGDH
ncbi:MarR family transcriptional regulator [Streptomyces sp. tea 10]|nr:MarR family transcriptional regulator [Streptomyces sp. tea 10]